MSQLPRHPIADLLPHRLPMMLLDTVVSRDVDWIVTRVVPRADMPFFVAGQGMPAHLSLEWMAQTCGAFVGAQALDVGGQPRIGFLLGTRDFRCVTPWFNIDVPLDIQAHLLFLDGSMGVFDCSVRLGQDGNLNQVTDNLATARLTVYQPPTNSIGTT